MLVNSITLLINNNIIVFKLTHTFIYSLILVCVYKKLNKNTFWIIITILIQQTICWYNTLISLLIILILILYDSKNKNKELYIGLIIGFIIMTKHNIGIALFIIYFFTSKNKIKSTLYFLIPIIISAIYLVINNDLINYINFCLLGTGNFAKNIIINPTCLIITTLSIIYLIINFKKTKDIKILYIIAALTIVFPLIEIVHLLEFTIIMMYYILLNEKNIKITLPLKILIFLYFIATILIYINDVEIIKSGKHIKYSVQSKNINNYLNLYSSYLNDEEDTYLFISNAYLIRIYNSQHTTIYDHLNKGNLEKNETKYIKEIEKNCTNKKCTFILDSQYFNKSKKNNGFQYIKEYKEYVIKNYKYVETLPTGDKIYSNK